MGLAVQGGASLVSLRQTQSYKQCARAPKTKQKGSLRGACEVRLDPCARPLSSCARVRIVVRWAKRSGTRSRRATSSFGRESSSRWRSSEQGPMPVLCEVVCACFMPASSPYPLYLITTPPLPRRLQPSRLVCVCVCVCVMRACACCGATASKVLHRARRRRVAGAPRGLARRPRGLACGHRLPERPPRPSGPRAGQACPLRSRLHRRHIQVPLWRAGGGRHAPNKQEF